MPRTPQPPPAPSTSTGGAPLPPVAPPRASWLRLLRDVLDHAGPGYLQFAITNTCNARCSFCNFAVDRLPVDQHRRVTLEEACEAIDIAARNHIGYLLFVGGEPLVHPDLTAMVRHATRRGIRPMICSNGALLTEERIHDLARAGLSSVILSIDAPEAARHEEHRGLPGVCDKIQRANRLFRKLHIASTASITASRLIDDYERLPDLLRTLGFQTCTFSYPLTALGSSYLSFSDSGLVSFTREELLQVFESIKALKRKRRFPVVNPTESLTDMQRHLRGERERFGCLAGFKYFYLDWHLNLYRCHNWSHPMCHIREFDGSQIVRDGCTRCMIDCYRDPSVLQYIAVSLSDAWHELRRGHPLRAARHFLDSRNLSSLRAIGEDWRFIREV